MAAFLILLLFFVASPVHAQSAQGQIEDKIQQVQDEIRAIEKELEAVSKQAQSLQSTVKTLDLQIQKLTKNISLTETQIIQKDRDIRALTGDISTTGGRIGDSEKQIGNTLRELNALDRKPLTAMLLGGATLSSFFDEAASLSALRQSLQNRIEDLSSLKTDLETDRSSAEKKRAELAGLQRKLAGEKKGLDVSRAAQQQLLKETQNKESNFQSILAQKRAEQATFEAELFQLASGGGTIERGRIPSPGSGVLRWPLDTVSITQQFGKTSDSGRLYVSGTHDGIDFSTKTAANPSGIGTPVKAARSGTVVEINQGAVANCQYGKWVLIKHDNGLTTLYAHLSNIDVRKGETV